MIYCCIFERSLELKRRTICTDAKQKWWAREEKRREEKRRSKKRQSQKQGIQVREKVGQLQNIPFFQWFEQVGLLKRLVRSHLARWTMKKCTLLRPEAHVQKCKDSRGMEHFWTFRCSYAWQAQGIVHLVKSEQNLKDWQQLQLQPPLHYIALHSTTLQLELQLQLQRHDRSLH